MARPALLVLLLAGLFTPAWAQKPPKQSPFSTRTTAPAPSAAAEIPADSVLEFSGVLQLGPTAIVCITTIADKRSRWIKIGESDDGILVPDQELPGASILVRYQGREVTLPFKQPVFDPSTAIQLPSMSTDPAPMAGVALNVAVTNEDKEAEARALVSDLLEIGMIQRKAYQDARAKETEDKRTEKQANPTPPPAPNP